MRNSRRSFLKQLASVVSAGLGGTQLAGCLGESNSQATTPQVAMQSGSTTSTTTEAASGPSPGPSQTALNSGPVWTGPSTIEFVEGVPAVVAIRDYVQDANQEPLIITLQSGTLIPGITFNPTNGTIAYDGRPLGAKPDAPVVVSGITFVADDRRN